MQRQQGLAVRWRPFSLAIHNNYVEEQPAFLAPLRVAALADREGGNEAVDRVYVAIGTAIHESGADVQVREAGVLERLIPEVLAQAGLDASLYQRALADPATLEAVRADYDEAKGRFAAFGVPWLVLDGHDLGFFGPVVDVPPTGQEALDLWAHTAWMITRPYLYELKRERA